MANRHLLSVILLVMPIFFVAPASAEEKIQACGGGAHHCEEFRTCVAGCKKTWVEAMAKADQAYQTCMAGGVIAGATGVALESRAYLWTVPGWLTNPFGAVAYTAAYGAALKITVEAMEAKASWCGAELAQAHFEANQERNQCVQDCPDCGIE